MGEVRTTLKKSDREWETEHNRTAKTSVKDHAVLHGKQSKETVVTGNTILRNEARTEEHKTIRHIYTSVRLG